jgi:uncharacterized protein
MKFYVTERLGPSRSLTPEGFLLCRAVPIARIGIMDYLEEELAPIEGDRGVIRVQRNEDEVFKPEALASFAGKPVVNDHPEEDVTPATWRKLAIGTIQNPRRGEGNLADVMLADLLITDEDGINAVQSGKVEVSCGYDAEYEQIKPGLARQHNIIGNHVALVEAGRCGPRCSIGDQAISITLKEGQMAKLTTKKSFKDRLMAAFKAKDEAAVEKLAGEVTEDEEPIAESEVEGGTGQHIHVHVTPGTVAPIKSETVDEEEGEKDPFKKFSDEMTKCMKDFGERIGKLENGTSTVGDEDPDEDDDEDTETTDAEGEEEDDDKKDKTKDKTKDGKGKTRDSAGLTNAFKDTVARAEILAPGIKLPTFDAKADRKKTVDALCAFRRKALDKAYTTDEGKAAIDPLLAGRTLDTKKLTCDTARLMFTAASENMKAVNRAANTGSGKIRANDSGTVKVPTIGDMNKGFTDFWKPKV